MSEAKKVLVEVAGRPVTEEDLNLFIQEMKPEVRQYFPGEEGKRHILDEMVNQELIYREALKNKLDEDPLFVNTLEMTKESLLKSYAFARIIEDIQVAEEEAKAYFDAHPQFFGEEASVEASHILVETEEEADKILASIKVGETFENMANAHSTCPSGKVGGTLGRFKRGMMVPEFDEVAFAMEEGELSKPVKTQFGYHLVRVDKKHEATQLPWEEAKEQAMSEARRIKQQHYYQEHVDALKNDYEVIYHL